MADYTYTRELVDGRWNVDNQYRLDDSEQIHLAKEVETALSGKIFTICCMGTEVKLSFTEALSGGEQTTLATTVQAHKDNT